MTEQLPLVCHGDNKRPKITDRIRRLAAEKLIDRMIKHGLLSADERDDCANDLVKVARFGASDGYHIARELDDRHHWDCDLQMAEELDDLGTMLHDIVRAEEKLWAVENPREPLFKAGDTVLWHKQPATIGGVSPYRPQCYEVHQGKFDAASGSAYIVPFEDVAPIPEG